MGLLQPQSVGRSWHGSDSFALGTVLAWLGRQFPAPGSVQVSLIPCPLYCNLYASLTCMLLTLICLLVLYSY